LIAINNIFIAKHNYKTVTPSGNLNLYSCYQDATNFTSNTRGFKGIEQDDEFVCSQKEKPVNLDCLKKKIPDIELFWQGQAILQNSKGEPVIAQISEVNPEDAEQVDNWYNPDLERRPYYPDQKWHDWWIEKIRYGEPNCKILKLEVNNEVLGVMMINSSLHNYSDQRLVTLIRGLRVSPTCSKEINSVPEYKGAGTALVTYATIESIKKNDTGITVNSSKGSEGFYETICGPSKELAYDGDRSAFTLSDDARKDFIVSQFSKYQKLKDQIT
jgi:hypothetical protein